VDTPSLQSGNRICEVFRAVNHFEARHPYEVVLAVFNMFPIPPLDGGRIAVGVLPDALAARFARLEPYGMLILIGLLFILPMLGAQLGADLNIVSQVIASSTNSVIRTILRLTGNT